MTKKLTPIRIPLHYWRIDGTVPCGLRGDVECTTTMKFVTCKNCLRILWHEKANNEQS